MPPTNGPWCAGSCAWERWSLPSGPSQLIGSDAGQVGKVRWRIRVIDSTIQLGYPGAKPAIISSVGKHRPSNLSHHPPSRAQCKGRQLAKEDFTAPPRAVSQADGRKEIPYSYSWGHSAVLLSRSSDGSSEVALKGLHWDSCPVAVREASLSVNKEEHFEVGTPENWNGKCYFKLVLLRNVHIYKALLSHI